MLIETNFKREVYCLLGLPFDALGMAGSVQRVRRAATRRRRCFISTPNVNFVAGARSDAAFRDSVIASDLSVADGMPLVWIARLLGIPLPERVSGASLFDEVSRGRSLSVYLFGGKPGVAAAAAERITAAGSNLVCAGYEYPGFGSVEDLSSAESIARINASGADFLVVSLGAKKGQAWIERNLSRLHVPVVSHLGAVVAFAAGSIRRAPAWMQHAGLEWLWRIKEEGGLARRYLADALTLGQLLLTRALPLAWHLRRHRPTQRDLDAAAIDLHETGRELVIRLHGAWTAGNLEPLRECFAEAASLKKHVRLDLGGVTHADSAFLGLLLLLYGAQKKQLRRLTCAPLSRPMETIFMYGCLEFLVPTDAAAPVPEMEEEEQHAL